MAAERDPRASRLEDDPFERTRSPGSHTRARDDGNWRQPHVRVVFASNGQGGQPFFRVFGEDPQPRRAYIHKGSIWYFSKIEIQHLIMAIIAFSFALAFMSVNGMFRAPTFTLSDLIVHLEKLGYSIQEIDEFIDLMVLEVKDFKRWNKLDEESKKYYNDIAKEL